MRIQILLILVVSLCGCSSFLQSNVDRTEYFPPGAFSSILWRDRADSVRLGHLLSRLKEPPLSSPHRSGTIRLLWLRSWDGPVVVRVEHDRECPKVLTKVGTFEHDATKVRLKMRDAEPLNRVQLQNVMKLVDKIPRNLGGSDKVEGFDGDRMVLEVFKNGEYRVIQRWSPEYETELRQLNEFLEASKYLLSLAGY